MRTFDDNALIALYRQCKTQAEIAKLLGIPQGTVSRAYRRLGLLANKVGAPKQRKQMSKKFTWSDNKHHGEIESSDLTMVSGSETVRICVHRHIDYPDRWRLSVYGVFRIENRDLTGIDTSLDDAKHLAVHAMHTIVAHILLDLGKVK